MPVYAATMTVETTGTATLIKRYLELQSELKRRGVSLKARQLKAHLSVASHDIASTLPKLSNAKAKAVNKFTRTTISKKVRD